MNNLVDKTKAITAEDLIRRYNLGNLAKDRKAINVLNDGLTKLNAHTEDFVKAVTKNLDELQDQVDGNITTWFFSGVPSIDNIPAVDWTTDDEKNNHLGDLYYDQDTGYAYRWGQYEGIYSWLRITDTDITKALALANSAMDTADSKRRTFYDEPIPPYDSGDIWIYKGEIYRCIRSRQSGIWNIEDWVNDLIYTDDTVANKAIEGLNKFSEEVKRDYVTNKVLEETAESFRSEVKSVQVKVNKKNTIFKTTPVPPYIVGDLFIENGKIYVCTTAREDGEYNKEDWELNLDKQEFATRTQFEQNDKEIKALSEQQGQLEKDIQTTKEASGNPIEVDDAGAYQLVSMEVEGKSYQETRSDKNKFMLTKGGSGYGITVTYNNDGTFNFTGTVSDNASANGSTVLQAFFPFEDMNVENGKSYTLSSNKILPNGLSVRCEVYKGTTYVRGVMGEIDVANPIETGVLNTNNGDCIRLSFQIHKGATIDIENIGFQIEEGTVATDWQPYGVMPSPNYPSKIKSIPSVINYFAPIEEKEVHGVKLTKNTDGTYNLKGTQTSDSNDSYFSAFMDLSDTKIKSGKQYVFSTNQRLPQGVSIRIEYYNGDTWLRHITNVQLDANHETSSGIANDENATRIRFAIVVQRKTTVNIENLGIQFEEGTVVHPYYPYGYWLRAKITGKNLYNLKLSPLLNDTGMTVVNSGPGVYLMSGTGTTTRENELRFLGAWNSHEIHFKISNGDYLIKAWLDDVAVRATVTVTNGTTANEYIGDFTIHDGEGISSLKVLVPTVQGKVYNNSVIKIMIVEKSVDDGNYEEYKENIVLIDMNKPNLFDKDNYDRFAGYINATSFKVTSATNSSIIILPCEKKTTYTVSKILDETVSARRLTLATTTNYPQNAMDTNVHTFIGEGDKCPSRLTITTGENDNYLLVFCHEGSNNSTTLDEILSHLKVYKGYDEEDHYELSSLLDGTKDTLNLVDGKFVIKKNINSIILNGNENKYNYNQTSGEERFDIHKDSLGFAPVNSSKVLYEVCSHFKYSNSYVEWGYFALRPDYLIFMNNDLKIQNLSNFVQILKDQYNAGTPVTIKYAVETPQTYTLPYTPLTLFEGYNRITVDDELDPNLKIKYLVNSKINADFVSRSEFNISNEGIKLEVGEKVSNDEFNSAISDLNSKLTLEAGEIRAEVSKTINDINIGGTNLLRGTATASGDVGYGSGTVTVVDTDLYGGLKGVKTHTAWTGRFMNLKAVASRGGFEVGDNLVASVYIKADRDVVATVTFHRSYGTGNIMGSTKSYRDVTLTPKWQQFWFPFTADDGSLNRTDTRVEINVATGDNYIYWAGWKLEKGTKATDWSPSPDDVNDEIKSVKGEVSLKIDEKDLFSKFNVNVDQVVINSKNFTLTKEGKITATAGKIGGFELTSTNFSNNVNGIYNYSNGDMNLGYYTELGYIELDSYMKNILDATGDGNFDMGDITKINRILNGNETNNKKVTAQFNIDSNNPKNFVSVKNGSTTIASIGAGGVNSKVGVFENLIVSSSSNVQADGVAISGSKANIVLQSNGILSEISPSKVNIKGDIYANLLYAKDSYGTNHRVIYSHYDDLYSLAFVGDYAYIEVLGSNGAYGINIWASDKRLKQDIKDSQVNALEIVKNIKHREFRYKKSPETLIKIGYVADELQELDEQMVFEVGEDKIKQPKESYIIPILSKAIQEQQKIIEEQNKKLDSLEARIKILEESGKEVNK